MKKTLLSIAAALISAASFGQFFTSTTYKGAFGVGSGANWMTGWTNFDPVNAAYPGTGEPGGLAGKTRVDIGAVADADGYFHITSNTTWSSSNVYYLNNPIAVDNGVTLTIQAGTYVRGLNNATPTCLVISRGAKLNAIGTSTNPIVMTSASVGGSRNTGDWGGLIIAGRAKVNLNKSPNLGGRNVEGTVTTAPATASYYGAGNGSAVVDDNESSGNMQYVRVEFAGDAVIANSELNGIMLAGVGSGTTFQHIQVSYSKDDSFEWFGGTVDGKYLVAFGGTDDDFDVDEGFRGRIQFGYILRDPRFCDYGSSAGSSNFLEMDNNTTSGGAATSDQTQYSPQPTTSCVFSNITAIGPLRAGDAVGTVSDRFGGGVNARTNPATAIFNSIILNPRGSVVTSNTPNITGASTVLDPSNWTKFSCDSLLFRNSAFLLDNANVTATINVGGRAGTAADCQGVFTVKDAAALETFLENVNNSNLVNKQATDATTLGIASPYYSGTLTTVPPTIGNFTNGPLSFTGVDPTLTVGSPFATGASFTSPRLGIASLPNLVISTPTTGVFGSYNNVTIQNGGSATLSGNVAVTGAFTVQNGGGANFVGNSVLGSGSFNINAGATVTTAAVGGFANAGNGVTRNSGAKVLSTDANYSFLGTSASSTGGFFTGGRDVAINNAGGVTLSSAATVGGTLALINGVFTVGNNLLTIGSTSARQGIIDDFSTTPVAHTGSLSGTSIKFRRYAGSGQLTSVAPPVISTANTINSTIVPTGLACSGVKEFDEFSNSWIPVDVIGGACTDPMVNSPAVLSANSLLAFGYGFKTYEFQGLPQTGTQTRSITRSPGTVPPAPFVARGWNALSNPYAAPISWSTFDIAGNLAQSPCIAYVWNSSTLNYGTVTPAGVAVNANNNIAPGQGILIRRSSVGTGNVNFEPSMRVSSTTQTYVREAVAVNQEVRLSLNGTESKDAIMVGSGADFINIDKMFSPSDKAVSLFIPAGEEGLTALTADLKDNTIPVSVKLPADGFYTISADVINGLPANAKVILEDKASNRFQELTEGSAYSFNGKATDAARFALHIQTSTASNGLSAQNVLIYTAGTDLNIRLAETTESSSVIVSDLAGRSVLNTTFSGSEFKQGLNLPSGVYTVTVRNASSVKTQKVFVKAN